MVAIACLAAAMLDVFGIGEPELAKGRPACANASQNDAHATVERAHPTDATHGAETCARPPAASR